MPSSSEFSFPRHAVIIGGGAVGLMSAIHALDQGLQVSILDFNEAGSEEASSYGNAGWLSSHSVIPPVEPGMWKKVPGYLMDPLGPLSIRWRYLPGLAPWLLRNLAGARRERIRATAKALRTLVADARLLHQEVAQRAGAGHLIDTSGVLHVYRSRRHFENDAFGWSVRRELGIRWTEIEGEELRRREPDLDAQFGFAVHVDEAGHCKDPGAYMQALDAYARARGARRVQGRATGFRIEQGRLKAVRTQDGEIACDAAVICAGARSRQLAAQAGDRVQLESERGYHATIAGHALQATAHTPMMVSEFKVIATQMEGGLRIAGQVEFASFEAAPDWRRGEIMRDIAQKLFPGLPRELPAQDVKFWLGRRPSTPDGMPCIGYAAASRDIVHAYGHGHIGLGCSARTGRIAAQLLAGQAPEIDLAPFSPQRF
ncbi:FAD-binding oxidoreductase [Herbaspirillum sp. WKF16]|jgi:D-amino-acid dehydrogenase|uniref:NAD(P)/FAD-dependent oxidoreductase n=1 Tax=Herbaspirillum sp. WKF16 TaxID=3028312 RepID=UPI0023A920F0|nr:FAD-binding oxidoreductase [Herbaspirillum sp. WKF16]WDZ95968.1 FAD-binding oxidoreductase [Herbaspirillum sp. WKF16]